MDWHERKKQRIIESLKRARLEGRLAQRKRGILTEEGRTSLRHRAKLTYNQVSLLRRLRKLDSHFYTYKRLSNKFGISISCVEAICNYKSYTHVKDIQQESTKRI